MKKNRCVLLSILLCVSLFGCGFNESKIGYPLPGTLVKISHDETMTVVDASIEDGKITVVLDVCFTHNKLYDFDSITIQKAESGYDFIQYDIDETIKQNNKESFGVSYIGKLILVFIDDSILANHDLSTYIMYVEYATENGIDGTKGFCIGRGI